LCLLPKRSSTTGRDSSRKVRKSWYSLWISCWKLGKKKRTRRNCRYTYVLDLFNPTFLSAFVTSNSTMFFHLFLLISCTYRPIGRDSRQHRPCRKHESKDDCDCDVRRLHSFHAGENNNCYVDVGPFLYWLSLWFSYMGNLLLGKVKFLFDYQHSACCLWIHIQPYNILCQGV